MSCMAPLYVINNKKKSSAAHQHKSSPFRSRIAPSNESQLINNTNSGGNNNNNNKRLLLTSDTANNSSLVSTSYRELAMKYYAAFPALGSSGDDDDCLLTADRKTLITATTKKPFNSNINSNRKRYDNNKWNGQRIIQLMSTADTCGDDFDSCPQRQTLNESTYWPKIADNAAKPTNQQLINENAIKSFNSKTFDTLIAKISEELICNNSKLSLTSISEDLLSTNTKNTNNNNNSNTDRNDSNNNNSSSGLSSLEIFGINGTKAVYCGDIEVDMIKQYTDSDNNGVNSCSLVDDCSNNRNNSIKNISNKFSRNSINNNNSNSNCETILSEDVYDYGSQEGEVFQKLVEKFNSNIASIWSSSDANEESVVSSSSAATTKSLSKSRDNIWSFDSSFSSSQSSATPSPKYVALNGIDMWSTAEVMDDKSFNMTPINLMPNLPTIPEIWESSVLQKSMKSLLDSEESAQNEENWISSELFVPQNNTKFEYNTTTLKNHQENSLFVEFSSAFRSLSKRENIIGSKRFDQKLSINAQTRHGKSDYEPEENLLISPKTHFTPIKNDSFDRDSDDGIHGSIDSEMSSSLVICSDKCPNNAGFIAKQSALSVTKPRAVSTSLPELSSFMGPFGDSDLPVDHFEDDSTSDSESNDAFDGISNEKRDISTNTDSDAEVLPSITTLEPIIEIDTSGECEPEYQDLCKMINEVLRNGLVDEYNSRSTNSSFTANGRNVLFDDWCTDNSTETLGDFKLKSDKEKRLSWNCYWDTYDTTNTTSASNHNSALIGVIGDCFRKDLLNVGDDKCVVGQHQDLLNDDVFVDIDCEDRYLFDSNTIDGYVDDESEQYSHTGELFHDPNLYCHQIIQIDENSVDDDYCLPSDDVGYDARIICDDDDDNLGTIVDDGNNDGFNDYHNDWESNNDSSVAELSSNLVALSTFKFEMKSKNIDAHHHTRNRKPCTFFLEGNCKRSDCKYSHDVSNITCKYWREGFCFKFDSCPFLHGYPA